MMWTAPRRTVALIAAIVVLLPLLAILQYQWLGELSGLEQMRARQNLEAATVRLSTEFDGRLAELAQKGPTFRAVARPFLFLASLRRRRRMARLPLSAELPPRFPHLPDNLLRIRREQRLSQQALAARLGKAQRRISELENGQRPRSWDEVTAIAAALGVEVGADAACKPLSGSSASTSSANSCQARREIFPG